MSAINTTDKDWYLIPKINVEDTSVARTTSSSTTPAKTITQTSTTTTRLVENTNTSVENNVLKEETTTCMKHINEQDSDIDELNEIEEEDEDDLENYEEDLLNEKLSEPTCLSISSLNSSTNHNNTNTLPTPPASSASSSTSSLKPQDLFGKTNKTLPYELSHELKQKEIEILNRKYGGHLRARRAARTIQLAYRQYKLKQNYEKLFENNLRRRSIDIMMIQQHKQENKLMNLNNNTITSNKINLDLPSIDFEQLVERIDNENITKIGPLNNDLK